jgi:hypothetical protein
VTDYPSSSEADDFADDDFPYEGYGSPEEAARGDIPEQYATVVGVRIEGDSAHVWLVTNDRPTFEGYEVDCVRKDGKWYDVGGSGGFDIYTPAEVRERAARLGYIDTPLQALEELARHGFDVPADVLEWAARQRRQQDS